MTNQQNPYNQQLAEQPQMGQPMGAPMMPAMSAQQGGRRARWNRKLMEGAAMAMKSLPDWFAIYAIATYAVALIGVNLLYWDYATEWYFWLFGIMWVAGFFALSVNFTRKWSEKNFQKAKSIERKLFWTGFAIRILYATAIYFFYIEMTGQPFEFAADDSKGYVELAQDWALYWQADKLWPELVKYANEFGYSDMGYPLFILIPVRLFSTDFAILFTRLMNAVFSALIAVVIYRITRRSMSETTARIAAIFCMLHPVLICYVGFTLKESFMTWLVVLFVDFADRLLRSRRYRFNTIAPIVLTGGALFFFRTVLGMVAFMALFTALVLMSNKIVSIGRKIIMGLIIGSILLFSASDKILRDVKTITETDVVEVQKNTMTKRYGSEKGNKSYTGNTFANYAGAAVFAPMIFTIPFPTMVEATIGQEDMRLIHGGNWMRNIMSGFVILAMVMLLLSGDWRNYTLPLAMVLGYLAVLVFSAFAQSLRFHIPVMPFEMMFAAYAITQLRSRHKRWYLYWCLFTIVTCFAWNWFKLAGRGLA